MGRPKDSKKSLVHPTTSSTVTSATAGSSKTSAPLKIKLPKLGISSKEKQKQHLAHTGTKKRPIILGKIPEDDDIEDKDVPVEEQFILRLMVPEDVKQRFREKVKSGKSIEDIGIIFKDPRRAIFTFENQKYRARLVDLPCIIEAQKTFNKIQYYKVADICQMLIVESQISSQEDEQLFTENSKSSNVDEFEWYDGLTPSLKNNVAFKQKRIRGFAKHDIYECVLLSFNKGNEPGKYYPSCQATAMSLLKIEDIEKEVEKLLHEDSLAEEVKLDSEASSSASEDDDDSVDEDPELTQIFSKREELTTEISRLEQDINNLETHFASAINPLIQGRLTSKIASAKEEISQKQQEIESYNEQAEDEENKLDESMMDNENNDGKFKENSEESENELEKLEELEDHSTSKKSE
ncbi:15610_t:CDS:2 [Funneliformis caledonium]|uniref:15610_t:CDS:1 n=1 Tax=Funneliformis caledonium TaxID=1117310 RepID=A0A9N9FZD1_9GLOM|nr:15610_t:CDS:2 [Funneliformis caledonium]